MFHGMLYNLSQCKIQVILGQHIQYHQNKAYDLPMRIYYIMHEKYTAWLNDPCIDKKTKEELRALRDDKEIDDRFYQDLSFGTGGLRGVMGAGTNRINCYTIRRATKGVAASIIAKQKNRRVAIAYDTRLNSRIYAEETAAVFCDNGIETYIFDEPMPTPVLSFAVRQLGCAAGIVITASHNPKEYNGYKVYNAKGGQLVPSEAKIVSEYIEKMDYSPLPKLGKAPMSIGPEILDAFLLAARQQSVDAQTAEKQALRIVYTPLHGTGRAPISRILADSGFPWVYLVSAQKKPDGRFPTVVSPNPENRHVLDKAIQLATEKNADIVLGTDPDCDRLGVAVRQADNYVTLTGNQLGALLVLNVLENRRNKNTLIAGSAVVKTVVTSELGTDIAKSYGLRTYNTLTGFKYIGEKISELEAVDAPPFVMGYEESYGYLVGDYARDKDAVCSALLVCEMAAKYKAQGKTLLDALEEIYMRYGYYYDDISTYAYPGKEGQMRLDTLMQSLRENSRALFPDISTVEDYQKGIDGLPRESMLRFLMEDGSWVAIRPSGTEPKLKVYYSLRAKNRRAAMDKFADMEKRMKGLIIQ